jgi:hypothetical protein
MRGVREHDLLNLLAEHGVREDGVEVFHPQEDLLLAGLTEGLRAFPGVTIT